MKKIFMFIGSIGLNRAGMTNAMYYRSKNLYDSGIPADIITFDYSEKPYSYLLEEIRKQGKMSLKTNHINIFDHIQLISEKNDSKLNTMFNKSEFSFSSVEKILEKNHILPDGENKTRYFDKSTGDFSYLKMQQSDEEMYIDVFERNKKIKRYCYYNNQLRKCINFNELAQPVSEIMFNGNELPYMQRGIHPHNGHPGWYFIFPYNKHFKNLSEVSSHVLSEIIKDEEDITVICDGPGSFNKLLAMEHTKIKKAIYIHTNHFEPPYNLGALVKKDHQYILDNASKVDYLVTPTNSQKRDISKEYPLINTITIPNYINLYNGPCEKDFTKNSFGVVCRLVEMKGIQDIISAMPYVLKEIPDACFEIYGEGPFKDNLVKQAEELNVSDNVLFHGYRSDLQTIFDGILFSISSSEYEGFGLSIAESLTYKTPVIAYDVNYGPSDLIKNDETGFLITHGNINEMAEKIIFLFNNKDKLKTMSGDAQIDINSRYSKKNISNLWQEIL